MPRLASLDRLRAAALTLMLLHHFTKWLAGDPRRILPGWEGFAFTDVCAPAFAAIAQHIEEHPPTRRRSAKLKVN